jgi:hypothetical protein
MRTEQEKINVQIRRMARIEHKPFKILGWVIVEVWIVFTEVMFLIS